MDWGSWEHQTMSTGVLLGIVWKRGKGRLSLETGINFKAGSRKMKSMDMVSFIMQMVKLKKVFSQ